MPTIYQASCHEDNANDISVIASSTEELTSKLNNYYGITKEQIVELIETKHVTVNYNCGNNMAPLYKTVNIHLDSTTF